MRFLPLLVLHALVHLVTRSCAAASWVPRLQRSELHQDLAWVRGGSTVNKKTVDKDSNKEGGASDDDKKKQSPRQSTWGGFFGAPSPAPLDSNNKTSSSPSKRRGLFGSKKQVNETKPETTLPIQQKESKDKKDKKEKQKKQAKDKKAPKKQQENKEESMEDKKDKTKKNPQEPTKDDSNTTSPDSASIIVLGGAPPGSSSSSSSGIRVIRATPPPPMRPGTGPVPPQDKSLMVAELITAVVRLGVRLWLFAWMRGYFSEHETIRPIQRFVWERLNDRYSRDAVVLQHVLSDPPLGVPRFWWRLFHNWRVLEPNVEVPTLPLQERFNRTVVVVPLQSSDGGGGELNLQFLRDVVSFLLQQYRAKAFGVGRNDGQALPLEVVLLVSSPGGSVTHYGLAAAQVKRLADEEGLTLTVCVDKIAASGGYMIASQAHKILSAPLATLGSVGVIFEGLNFRDLAREYGIQPIVLKAGKYKNPTSTLFGPISQADEKYENERLAKIHEAFQDLVVSSRPELKDQKGLLEGQVYLGSEALDLNLVDELKTSDEYIMELVAAGDRVLKLHQSNQRSMQRRLYHLSPLDLLPHLRTWVSKHATSQNLTSLLLAIGPAWGFAQHLIQQLCASRFSPSQDDD